MNEIEVLSRGTLSGAFSAAAAGCRKASLRWLRVQTARRIRSARAAARFPNSELSCWVTGVAIKRAISALLKAGAQIVFALVIGGDIAPEQGRFTRVMDV